MYVFYRRYDNGANCKISFESRKTMYVYEEFQMNIERHFNFTRNLLSAKYFSTYSIQIENYAIILCFKVEETFE